MPLHTWLLYAASYLAITLVPGPNVLLAVRNTMRYGAQGTALTLAGNLGCQFLMVVLVALGVGSLLAAAPSLFFAIKLVGAAYLIYLGARQLFSKQAAATPVAVAAPMLLLSRQRIFWEALLVSAGNPKTVIFLSAFMPQFISHDRPLAPQFAVMYFTGCACVVMVHCVYSAGVRTLAKRLDTQRWVTALKRASGALFVGLGLKLLTTQRT